MNMETLLQGGPVRPWLVVRRRRQRAPDRRLGLRQRGLRRRRHPRLRDPIQ